MTIKRVVLAVVLSLACVVVAHASDFADGWKCGLESCWKQFKGQYSYAPYPPFAPFPPLGQDDYRDGFAAGVVAGSEAAEEQD